MVANGREGRDDITNSMNFGLLIHFWETNLLLVHAGVFNTCVVGALWMGVANFYTRNKRVGYKFSETTMVLVLQFPTLSLSVPQFLEIEFERYFNYVNHGMELVLDPCQVRVFDASGSRAFVEG